jgi:ABC-type polysaccharide/polyol phosphate export permease
LVSASETIFYVRSHQKKIGKIYFPRLIFPLTAIFAKLVDFGVMGGAVRPILEWKTQQIA